MRLVAEMQGREGSKSVQKTVSINKKLHSIEFPLS